MEENNTNYQVVAIVSPPDEIEIPNLGELNKTEIIALAEKRVEKIHENGDDLGMVACRAAKMGLFAESIIEASRNKVYKDVSAYGKGGYNKEGVNLTATETGVKYSYSGDPVWVELNEAVKAAEKKRNEHQEILKKLPREGKMMMDDSTGELYRAYPPVRTANDSIKITIK